MLHPQRNVGLTRELPVVRGRSTALRGAGPRAAAAAHARPASQRTTSSARLSGGRGSALRGRDPRTAKPRMLFPTATSPRFHYPPLWGGHRPQEAGSARRRSRTGSSRLPRPGFQCLPLWVEGHRPEGAGSSRSLRRACSSRLPAPQLTVPDSLREGASPSGGGVCVDVTAHARPARPRPHFPCRPL